MARTARLELENVMLSHVKITFFNSMPGGALEGLPQGALQEACGRQGGLEGGGHSSLHWIISAAATFSDFHSVPSIDVTSVTLSCLNSTNAIDVTRC